MAREKKKSFLNFVICLCGTAGSYPREQLLARAFLEREKLFLLTNIPVAREVSIGLILKLGFTLTLVENPIRFITKTS